MSAYDGGTGLGSAQNTLRGPNEKKNRARIGQHPEPGGLFHQAKRPEEETASWQRIGSALVPSAELSRTSSYSLTLLRPPPASLRRRRTPGGTVDTALLLQTPNVGHNHLGVRLGPEVLHDHFLDPAV